MRRRSMMGRMGCGRTDGLVLRSLFGGLIWGSGSSSLMVLYRILNLSVKQSGVIIIDQKNKQFFINNFPMLQRSIHSYEYDTLYAENSALRERVRKISQIEPYIELLLQNNKKYQEELKDLQIENNKLRGRVDAILEETILLKEAHKNELIQVKSGFESDIERLIRELKDILRDKQAMQDANRSLIEELTTRAKKDSDTKKRQLEELEIQSTRKIGKLNEIIKGKEKLIEEISEQFKYKEGVLIEDIDQLNYKLNLLIKDKEHLSKEIEGLNEEKRTLVRKNKELAAQNEEVSTKWFKSDQEKSENLLQLKNKNIELGKRADELEDKLRVQDKIINEQNRKIGHLTKQCDDILNLKNEVEGSLRRNIRSLEELKAEHAEVVAKLDLVSRTTDTDLKKQSEQLDKLSEQNKRLNRENIEIISENKDKTSEIEDLIRAIQKLQRKIADLNQKSSHLESQTSKKSTQIKTLQQKLEDTLLQKKSLAQKLNLYSSHNLTLQEMLQKQKRRNACLQTSRYQIETIAMGALSKPEEICREYEKEIEKIVQEFLLEKQQIQMTHDGEIQHIKSVYEEALKQKDEYFNRKILFLQKEMTTLRTIK